MQLHIIVLPSRRKQIEEEVNRIGIDAVYWDGIVIPGNPIVSISSSHKRIVRYALQNKMSEIAIAEDDCIFTSINSWKYFLEHKPKTFDLYLGNHYSGIPVPPENKIYGFSGMTIYIIAQKFYKTFLSVNDQRSIDGALTGLGEYYVCKPEIAKQRHGYSFHRKRFVNDDHYLKNRTFLSD